MMAMQAPWLDSSRLAESIGGFTELQTIEHALNKVASFENQFTDALRTDLGDWRDKITWRSEMFADVTARRDFYVDRGLNTDLTEFSEDGFNESLSAAGVRREPPALVVRYATPVPLNGSDVEEEAFVRTNAAHDWLQRLESQLRQFIDEVMTNAFDQDWPKHRLPKDLYEKWMEKKEKVESRGGQIWPLIAYADFTDYEQIITKKGNWPHFQAVFRTPESVRESLQRLYPIRICTMHARVINQDDQLFVYVEAKRLIMAIHS